MFFWFFPKTTNPFSFFTQVLDNPEGSKSGVYQSSSNHKAEDRTSEQVTFRF